MKNDINLEPEVERLLRKYHHSFKYMDYAYGVKALNAISDIQPVRVEKVPSRNENCACGSGRKYKKCCLK